MTYIFRAMAIVIPAVASRAGAVLSDPKTHAALKSIAGSVLQSRRKY
jgi:hypothetical protein